jgi:predicted ATP-dependent endonuclease of OLD family
LNENTGKVVLLDEPASNLHPNMQRRFVGAIKRAQAFQRGRQALIVTHSQHLVPTRAKDLAKIRRLQRTDSSTVVFGIGPQSQISPDRLEKEMRAGSDIAGLLFARGVVLVEGLTETAAISVWYPLMQASEGKTLADDNIALYFVDGKPNFPLHMQYLEEFGIPWVVICDVDALDPALPNTVWEQLKKLGRISELPSSEGFAALKQLAETCGVFTANTTLTETKGFEDIPQIKQFLDANPWARHRSKARQGQVIAHNLSCPQGVEEITQAALDWLRGSAIEKVRQRASSQELTV